MELSIEWKNKLLNEKVAVRFANKEDMDNLCQLMDFRKKPSWQITGILMRFDEGDTLHYVWDDIAGNSFYKKEGYTIINFEEIVNKTEEFNIWN